ncbi:MAG: M48 family metallopeptidase [Bacteroidia bacterium]|nr:M48 family metallopeptidase [Bacteroidia bacterium]
MLRLSIFRYSLLSLLFLSWNFSKGQNFLGHSIEFTPKHKPASNYDEKIYEQILNKRYETELHSDEFIEGVLNSKRYFENSNYQYEHLDSINAYLNKILGLLVDLKKHPLKIKVCRDPSINASAFEDSTIYVNIGLLSFLENEAELASIIGHEVSHILDNDILAFFQFKKKLEQNLEVGYESAILGYIVPAFQIMNYSNSRIDVELRCDRIGAEILKKSGFYSKAILTENLKFEELHKKYVSKNGKSEFKLLYVKTHPSSTKRVLAAQQLCSEVSGRKFLIDSVYFNRMKYLATDETINLLFEEKDLDECLEKSYAMHLVYPKDPFYLFYVTECLRKIKVLKENASKPFIIGTYNKPYNYNVSVTSKHVKTIVYQKNSYKKISVSCSKSCFYTLNDYVKSNYKVDTNYCLFNNDTLEFTTNSEALVYFQYLNKKLNYTFNNLFADSLSSIKTSEHMLDIDTDDKKKFFENLLHIKNLFNQQNNDSTKILLFIYDVNYYNYSQGFLSENDLNITKYKLRQLKTRLNDLVEASNFSFENKLNLRENSSLLPCLKLLNSYLSDSTINIQYLLPELLPVLLKNNYSGILFSKLSFYYTESISSGMAPTTVKMIECKPLNTFLDFKHNKIKCLKPTIAVTEIDGVIRQNIQYANFTKGSDFYNEYFKSLLLITK